ncbi:MAG: carboxypeptidase regulatory-like domain-containing protein [Myxococcales bacterium]|nr:carboxypeptidase regulatory-like domain-containing protein [Myxococcales bacterium]
MRRWALAALVLMIVVAAVMVARRQRPRGGGARPTADVVIVAGGERKVAGATLRGAVVDDATGAPVAAAAIAVVARGGASAGRARVVEGDSAGEFALRLAAGRYLVRAAADGRAQRAPVEVVIVDGADREVTLRVVTMAAAVTGTVMDLESGVLTGASVEAIELGTRDSAPVVAVTDGAGRYRLALAAGPYLLTARFDGYVDGERRVMVERGARVEDFRLAPAATIRGRVLRAEDRGPIAGACVQVEAADELAGFVPAAVRPCVTSGADGAYELTGVSPGVVSLGARAPGWGQATAVQVSVGIGETRDGVELLLEAASDVHGVVVDQRERPIEGVAIVATRPEDLGVTAARATSDAAGAFVLEGLTVGHYLVRSTPGQAALATAAAAIAVPSSESLVLRVARGVSVSGQVSPARPGQVRVTRPLEAISLDGLGTSVTAEALLTAPIDEQGRFQLDDVPAGTWDLVASTEQGGGSARVEVQDVDLRDVTIVLDRLASICGTVREASGGTLGAVTVTPSLRNQPVSLPTTAYRHLRHASAHGGTPIGSDGSFCLRDLSPGDYLLVARDDRQALMWAQRHLDAGGSVTGVTLEPGEQRTGYVLEVHRPLVTLRGRVVDEQGAPVADALVTADRDGAIGGSASVHFPLIEQSGPAGPAVTDAAGEFTLEVLPAPHRLVAEHAARGLRGTAVQADPARPAIVRVERAGTIRGAVRGGAGACRVRADGPRSAVATGTGSDCAFVLAQLPAGRYELSVRRGDTVGAASVELAAGASAAVTVELAAEATVVARLVDATGAGVAGQLPLLIGADTASIGAVIFEAVNGARARSDARGRIELRAAVGPAALAVLSPDGQRMRLMRPVTIVAPTPDLGTLTLAP